MEEVTILEASRRLNVSQDIIRKYVREGQLKARRQSDGQGKAWLIELPESGWQDHHKEKINGLAKQLTPWWWNNDTQSGYVHYVDSLGIEEVEPRFMCGETGPDIWPAVGHTPERRCPVCLKRVMAAGMPLETRE